MSGHGKNRNIKLQITSIKRENRWLKFQFVQEPNLNTLGVIEQALASNAVHLENSPNLRGPFEIPQDSLCCLKSANREKWCRARVQLRNAGYGTLVVQLIDYGDMEVVKVENIRPLPKQFMELPGLALEGILADVIPRNGAEWPDEAIQFCEKHLFNETLSGCVINEIQNIPVIRIAKTGEREAFVQKLIDGGLAQVDTMLTFKPPEIHPVVGYKYLTLDPDSSHLVTIPSIRSPFRFYIQLCQVEMELKSLMDHITAWVNHNAMPCIQAPVVGLPCLAQLTQNSTHYYRAIIREVHHGTCKIKLVDFGHKLSKEYTDLKPVPHQFLHMPAQAICCSLQESLHLDTETFSKISKSLPFVTCHVLGRNQDSFVVKLMQGNQDLFMPILPQPVKSYQYKALPTNTNMAVTLSFIVDPTEFYCQLVASQSQLDYLTQELNSTMAGEPLPEVRDLVPGYPVVAIYSEDGMFYRATVTKFENPHNIEVAFIDYGNSDKLSYIEMRVVPPHLLGIPALCYKSFLHGLPQDGSRSVAVTELFEKLADVKSLMANVKTFDKDRGYGMVLFQTDSPLRPVNNILLEHLSDPVTGTRPAVDKIEKVFVTCVSSSMLFFGQLVKTDQNLLNQLQLDMNNFYNAASHALNYSPKVGDLVSCKFVEDEQFYRATVETVQAGKATVFFLDFGNRDTVNASELFPLNASFLKYPFFGIECCLETNKADKDKMEDLIMDKELQVQLVRELNPGKWLVTLIETYAGNSEVLAHLKQLKERNLPGATGYNSAVNGNFNDVQHERALTKKPELVLQEKKLEPTDYEEMKISSSSYKEVFVCHVISPNRFYCQLISENEKLQKLVESLNKKYNSISDNELCVSKKVRGTPCCAKDSHGTWNRGRFTDNLEVFFVDFGNSEQAPDSQLRALHADFFALPPQSVSCGLFNTLPKGSSWSNEDIDAFKEMFHEKSFIAQFVSSEQGNSYLVNLLKLQDMNTLNCKFVKSGHGTLKDENKHLVFNSLVASTGLEFVEPDISYEKELDVTIPWAINSIRVYCQFKSSQSALMKLAADIQRHYKSEKPDVGLVDRPHAGVICVAQYASDNLWYRARILNVKNDTVQVYYVDYGNVESVSKKKLKYILPDFVNFPVQALNCQIQGLKNPTDKLNQKALELFDGDQIKCIFKSKAEDRYLVDLRNGNKNVGKEMVSMNLAAWEPGFEMEEQEPVKDQILDLSKTFQVYQLVNVIISYVENPSKLWIQLEDMQDQLNSLMDEIDVYCSVDNDSFPNWRMKPGSLCIAKYDKDNMWYRARIVQCYNPQQANVFFVDYGNSEDVLITDIKASIPKLEKLPHQAIQCQFSKLPQIVIQESTEKLKEIAESDKELMIKIEKVDKECLTISMFDTSDANVEVDVLESIFGVVLEESAGVLEYLPVVVPMEQCSAFVTAVVDPSNFYAQLTSQEPLLEQLQVELAKYDTIESSKLGQGCVPGNACCAKFSEDQLWYRAKVVSVKADSATVLFVDYGNVEIVDKTSLKLIEPKLLETPPCALPCRLASVAPIEEKWSDDAIEKFNTMTQEVELTLTFVSQTVPALVHVEKEGSMIHEELVQLQLAKDCLNDVQDDQDQPKLDAYTVRNIADLESPAKICFVQSYSTVFVNLDEWCEELDTILELLSIVEEQSAVTVQNPQLGQPCLAKLKDDGTFYRSIITAVEDGNVTVTFVDYGNSEVVELTELKPITPELYKYPACSVECFLTGLKVVEGKETELETALQEYFDLSTGLTLIKNVEKPPYPVRLPQECLDSLITKGVVFASMEESNVSVELTTGDDSIVTYPKRSLSQMDKMSVTISYVETWNAFYVSAWNEELDEVSEKLAALYESNEANTTTLLSTVTDGQACAAKCSEDGLWYRAMVTSVQEDSICIQFVDYGNSENTQLSALRQISSELVVSPPLCVKCTFTGVHLAGNEDDLLSKIQELCGQDLVLEVEFAVPNDASELLLWKTDTTQFLEKLIEDGLLVSMETETGYVSAPDEESQNQVPERLQDQESFKENLQIAFVDTSLDYVETLAVPLHSFNLCDEIVGTLKHHKVSGELLYLYIVSSCQESSLENLQEELQKSYESDQLDDYFAKHGQHCVAKFPDHSWYRVEVLNGEWNPVLVKSLDFGNLSTVSNENIRKLKPEFTKAPRFAIACCPSEIRVMPEQKELLKKKLLEDGDSEYKLTICKSTTPHNVLCVKSVTSEDKDFLKQLVNLGICTQTFPIHNDILKQFECIVQAVNDDLTVWLLPLYLVEEKTKLQHELQAKYDSFVPSELTELSRHPLFAIRKDSQWYRAKVLEIHDNTALVLCVDYGFTCSVDQPDVVRLYPEFSHVSPFVLHCSLHGLMDSDIDDASRELLKNEFLKLVEGQSVQCTIKTMVFTSGMHSVELSLNDTDVLSMLIPQDTVTEELSSEGMKFTDEVPVEVDVQPEDGIGEGDVCTEDFKEAEQIDVKDECIDDVEEKEEQVEMKDECTDDVEETEEQVEMKDECIGEVEEKEEQVEMKDERIDDVGEKEEQVEMKDECIDDIQEEEDAGYVGESVSVDGTSHQEDLLMSKQEMTSSLHEHGLLLDASAVMESLVSKVEDLNSELLMEKQNVDVEITVAENTETVEEPEAEEDCKKPNESEYQESGSGSFLSPPYEDTFEQLVSSEYDIESCEDKENIKSDDEFSSLNTSFRDNENLVDLESNLIQHAESMISASNALINAALAKLDDSNDLEMDIEIGDSFLDGQVLEESEDEAVPIVTSMFPDTSHDQKTKDIVDDEEIRDGLHQIVQMVVASCDSLEESKSDPDCNEEGNKVLDDGQAQICQDIVTEVQNQIAENVPESREDDGCIKEEQKPQDVVSKEDIKDVEDKGLGDAKPPIENDFSASEKS